MGEEQVAELLPEGSRVCKILAENRWRVRHSESHLSRSWIIRPPGQCILEIARFCWDAHFLETGERCSVQGLFTKK